ncbi:hypothetical protein H6P81_012370 [Aristolochia fimbriata]|uniref:DYW domain-containing protein n=1 Tax=Aristolochia fimbriata TaxID=158543 RepID=A0AAV7EBL2_ARIFI|nr:hypothetical protein H6P81_012370 [Aristolochia fimbriata]
MALQLPYVEHQCHTQGLHSPYTNVSSLLVEGKWDTRAVTMIWSLEIAQLCSTRGIPLLPKIKSLRLSTIWEPPPYHFLKVNFNCSSTGGRNVKSARLQTVVGCKLDFPVIRTRNHCFSGHAALLPEDEDICAGTPPKFDSFTYTRLFRESIINKDATTGRGLHCHVIKNGSFDIYVWNTLLHLYVKSDLSCDASCLFDEIPEHNIVSFVTLIQGYASWEKYDDAVKLFLRLHREGYKFNAFVFTTILKLLVDLELPELNKCIHACVYKIGYDSDPFVGAALIDTYSMSALVSDAREVFDRIIGKDLVSWTGMITCYAENGYWEEALELFSQMRTMGFQPNNYTFSSLLKACTGLELLLSGKSVHGFIIKCHYESDNHVAGGLLDMYAKCGDIKDSRQVFEAMTHRNVILWSFMISRYAQSDHSEEAIMLFHLMRQTSVIPNDYSFSSVLQAIANVKDLEWGRQAHAHLVKVGFDSDIYVANALVDVYAKCGKMEDAMQLFFEIDKKNEVTWNTLIVGFVQLGHWEEAFKLFCDMLDAQVPASQVTYSGILRACAGSAVLEQGTVIHSLVSKSVFLDDTIVCNALVDMYAKCGAIKYARKVFDTMEELDLVSWNAIISAYALHGLGEDALKLFTKMQESRVKPNHVTFVGVLSACNHVGLIDQGRSYFNSMIKDYGIEPCKEHYTCMVGLLGHAGHLDEAMKFIEEIPVEPSIMAWRALLGSCVIYNNIELGKICGQRVLEMDPQDGTTSVMLSNMYAAAGRWDEVSSIRKSMRRNGLKKEPGLSWIEVQSEVHCFSVGDRNHPETRLIHGMLEWLYVQTKKAGYIPNKSVVLHDMEDSHKELLLWVHSERLALAFGLLKTHPSTPIRIMKNLRACADCHEAFKVICRIVQREIVVRDLNRFHHFENGFCSCHDYCCKGKRVEVDQSVLVYVKRQNGVWLTAVEVKEVWNPVSADDIGDNSLVSSAMLPLELRTRALIYAISLVRFIHFNSRSRVAVDLCECCTSESDYTKFWPIGQKRLTNVAVVRLKKHGLRFEIACYKNKVLSWRSGVEKDLDEVLQSQTVYSNVSKGILAKSKDLKAAFGTDDQSKICLEILDKGELQVAGKERESQLSSQFRDIATIVMQKTFNPETQRPYTISMIERLMHEIHFAVDPHNSSKKQALAVIRELQKQFPIKRSPMRLKLVIPENQSSSLMEKLNAWNVTIVSKDESGSQMSLVFEMDPGYYRECDSIVRNLQGRLEILAVSVHVEGDTQVDDHDDHEDMSLSNNKDSSDTVVYLADKVQKHTISTENETTEEQQVKQNKCTTCNAVVGDAKQYREHFKRVFLLRPNVIWEWSHTWNVKVLGY